MLLKVTASLVALAALGRAAALPADLDKRAGCPRGSAATSTSPLRCTPCAQLFEGSQLCTATAPITCSAPDFLNAKGDSCVTDCGSTSYGTTKAPRKCIACTTTYGFQALTCSETGALTCKGRTKLYNGACVASCPSNTYATSGSCTTCSDPGALTCNADGALTCMSGQVLTLGVCATPISGPYALLRDFELPTSSDLYINLPNTTPGQCASYCAVNGIPYSKTAGDFALGADRFCLCKPTSAAEFEIYPTNELVYNGFPAYLMIPGQTCAQLKPGVRDIWQSYVDERCVDTVFTANVCARADNGGACY
ncbi:hypothetical protein BCR35DRAFT_329536 [Leucosporidium creatinivorum]|uniref:Insulin-like growth factor binding protein n=1 Tax=Leucosporidium creatinivorum TaxID=106004 RepID=A0A1Y2FYD6_9BASI|nr:hypothetical protein BCR35DRAFT_329536 [Leucosporidium creatinivorum]